MQALDADPDTDPVKMMPIRQDPDAEPDPQQ